MGKHQITGHYSTSVCLRVDSAEEKKREILQTFQSCFAFYEELFHPLHEKAYYVRADPLRHPLIFYLGHTAVFAINKLVLSKLLNQKQRVNPHFESLFAVGVDEMSWDSLLPDSYSWPSVAQVLEYRKSVRETISKLILSLPLSDNSQIDWNHPFWPVLMSIEHERIHLETSSVLIRQLPLYLLDKPDHESVFSQTCPKFTASYETQGMIPVEGGTVSLGRSMEGADKYGWDNEFGHDQIQVDSFALGKFMVTNRQFLEFVEDDGYTRAEFWSEEGWRWREYVKAFHPIFWVKRNDSFVLRNLFQETSEFPLDWPVEVTFLEAAAYCQWKSAKTGKNIRIPTEAEYAKAEQSIPKQSFENIGLTQWSSSSPVEEFGIVGNAWEWTSSTMYPFNGFKVHPLYDDFTAPTFDDRHNIIKGGSWISCGNVADFRSRYAFRRHFVQHCGFRLIESTINSPTPHQSQLMNAERSLDGGIDSAVDSSNPYEADSTVNMYCDFHFSPLSSSFQMDHFPVVCARICQALIKTQNYQTSKPLSVLDLGCAVGRTSFELATTFERVVGIDFSARFVQVACSLLKNQSIRYSVPVEGAITSFREASLFSPEFPLDGSDGLKLVRSLFGPDSIPQSKVNLQTLTERLQFLQGDACNLSEREELFGFDVIVCCNLIDRLYDPSVFLTTIHERIAEGGYLILFSPYTWLEEYTPMESWVGGKKVDGENVFTQDGLELQLSAHFERVSLDPFDPEFKDCHAPVEQGTFESADGKIKSFHVPFLIRETHRKFQYTFSECTIWKKL